MSALPTRWLVRTPGGSEYEGWTDEMIGIARREGVAVTKVRETPLDYHCGEACGMCAQYNAEGRRIAAQPK